MVPRASDAGAEVEGMRRWASFYLSMPDSLFLDRALWSWGLQRDRMNKSMIKKLLLLIVLLCLGLVLIGFTMYEVNSPPSVPRVEIQPGVGTQKPFVVRIHARWCPVCMITKGTWTDLQGGYTGRVHLVVFDLTNDETATLSRAEATRLGLAKFFDEHGGETGAIFVLD